MSNAPLRVLFVASECAPVVKVGGLADVIGALPKALNRLGVDVSIAIPKYKELSLSREPINQVGIFKVNFGEHIEEISLYRTSLPGSSIPLYLLENQSFLSGGGVYFSKDAFVSDSAEIDRFAFFSKAVADLIRRFPDMISREAFQVIHCHDWHTGLVPQLVRGTGARTVFTIHNLANQGFSKPEVTKRLGLDLRRSRLLSWDAADGNLDFILQGIVSADWVTTVSPSYAKEILTPEFGEGLHEVLQGRSGRVVGILNGIDNEVWDPGRDPVISTRFGSENLESGKEANKLALLSELGLEVNDRKMLLAMVSRLSDQKGFGLVLSKLDEILGLGCQLIVLGVGDSEIENQLRKKEEERSRFGDFRAIIRFDDALSHRVYAGSDAFLMPSRFEPCGLTPMIAMRYGTLPIVHSVGGLRDSVKDGVNGFGFRGFEVGRLFEAISRAVGIYQKKNVTDTTQGDSVWVSMVKVAMREDFSWSKSAREYVTLYEKVLGIVG